MNLYLIKRGPRPDYHKAPYHPVILCTRVAEAKWQAGATSELAWVWEKYDATPSSGWDLCRWNGFDIVGICHHNYRLPDGLKPGIVHDRQSEPRTLLAGAVWWSNQKMPTWLQEKGVIYPPDSFTQECIIDNINNSRGRNDPEPVYPPDFWPEAQR